MAQSIAISPRRAALWVGVESTFASAATTTRAHPIEGSIELALTQTELANNELRARIADYLPPVLGNKGGTIKFSCWMRPQSTQVTATTTAATTYLGILLRAALGGEFPADGATNAGTTVASGTASSVVLSAGHGARLSKGMVFIPSVGSVREPAYIANISTDTITPVPALSGSPDAADAYTAYSYYWTEAAPPSLTIELALGDSSSQQWRLLGCMCTGLEVETTRDQLIKLTFSFEVADWSGPSNLSLSVTQASNGMAAPVPIASTQLILQAAATTTYPSAFYSAPEFKLSIDTGLAWATELGGTQGKTGITRVGARPVCKATVTAYPDISGSTTVPDATWWTSRTALQAQLRAYAGTGDSRRWCGFCLPTVVVFGKPQTPLGSDTVQRYQFELHSQLSTITTSPTTDGAYSPVVAFFG